MPRFRTLRSWLALAGFLALAGAGALAQEPAPAPAPIETLVEVLRDDAAREALIGELEAQIAAEAGDAEPGEPAPPEPISLGGRIADFSQAAAEAGAASARQFWEQLRAAPAMFGALGRADYSVLLGIIAELVLLAAVSYGLYFVGRLATRRFRSGLRQAVERSSWFATALAALVMFAASVGLVLLAWAAGYVVALALLGTTGRIPFHQSLFLNAFLAVEMVQALVRAVLAPARAGLRLVPISDGSAKMLARWFRATGMVLAFGQLLAVPIFNRNVSLAAGQAVSVLTYVIVLALVVNLVLRLRESVAVRLDALAVRAGASGWRFMAPYWHVPVLAYLMVLFVVVLLWPGEVLASMLLATLKVGLAVVLGMGAAALISRMVLAGVRLPGNVTNRMPLLEQRLNAFVPRALTALRVLVVTVVAAVTLDAIGLFSVTNWLESELGGRVAASTVTVALILIVAFAAWLSVTSWVDYRLQRTAASRIKARERTLLVLFRNAASIVIVVFASMFALSEVGLDIAPLLASAGVIGLAIGFGAQRLVQDIITGIFIQLEGAIDVGDVVSIGGISGSVERLTIRSAGLRDANGVYHVIPFSSVTTVSNFMRGFAYAVIDMVVPATESLTLVQQAMAEAHDRLRADPAITPDLVDRTLDFMGIDRFDGPNMVVRARIKTLPGRQWSVTRAFNALVKAVFEERLVGKEKPAPALPPAGEAAGDAEHAIAQEKAREEARNRPPPPVRRAPEVPDSDAS